LRPIDETQPRALVQARKPASAALAATAFNTVCPGPLLLAPPIKIGLNVWRGLQRRGLRTVVTLELARSAARAHLDLLRIRKVRAASVQQLNINFEKWLSAGGSSMDQKRNMTHIALLRLNRIDRYERRAAWRRDKALRAIGLATRSHEKALESDDQT